ncbi:uncharacterized protein LOC120530504 [Polypterus senegalus]|uniref:uncharacterized protein LOC120530504 n=1 Tax=Polypterus senegalus TaxID=55291 RepID=UPI0019624B2D|nr:uncharacterized protein LOC120530504 [Polypterus senegalus]
MATTFQNDKNISSNMKNEKNTSMPEVTERSVPEVSEPSTGRSGVSELEYATNSSYRPSSSLTSVTEPHDVSPTTVPDISRVTHLFNDTTTDLESSSALLTSTSSKFTTFQEDQRTTINVVKETTRSLSETAEMPKVTGSESSLSRADVSTLRPAVVSKSALVTKRPLSSPTAETTNVPVVTSSGISRTPHPFNNGSLSLLHSSEDMPSTTENFQQITSDVKYEMSLPEITEK